MVKRRYIDIDDVAWERLKIFSKDIGVDKNKVLTIMIKMLTRLAPNTTVESSLMTELVKIFTEEGMPK
jgi:hypothetical protein